MTPKVPMERQFRFPRVERLKGRGEIQAVFRQGKGISYAGVKLFRLENGLPYNRIAFTFTRKFGDATERNRSRRVSREAYRLMRKRLKTGFDLVLLVYPGKDLLEIRLEQLRILFTKAYLFMEAIE